MFINYKTCTIHYLVKNYEKEVIPLLRDQFGSLVDCLVLLGFLDFLLSMEAD